MPIPTERPSLSKDLATRYASQREGGAFDVKDRLGAPGSRPVVGTAVDNTSMNGQTFQSPNGFVVGANSGQTQMKDAQGTVSKQLSMYIRGFSNRKYKG